MLSGYYTIKVQNAIDTYTPVRELKDRTGKVIHFHNFHNALNFAMEKLTPDYLFIIEAQFTETTDFVIR